MQSKFYQRWMTVKLALIVFFIFQTFNSLCQDDGKQLVNIYLNETEVILEDYFNECKDSTLVLDIELNDLDKKLDQFKRKKYLQSEIPISRISRITVIEKQEGFPRKLIGFGGGCIFGGLIGLFGSEYLGLKPNDQGAGAMQGATAGCLGGMVAGGVLGYLATKEKTKNIHIYLDGSIEIYRRLKPQIELYAANIKPIKS